MSKVLNKGAMRQVKLSSGVFVHIPRGISTQPDDPKIKRLVESKASISFATNKNLATPRKTVKKVEPPKELPKEKPAKKSEPVKKEIKKKEPAKKE